MAVAAGKGNYMKKTEGKPLPLGVSGEGEKIKFSVAVPEGKSCSLLLYRAGEEKPCLEYPMEEVFGEVRYLALEDLDKDCREYNYRTEKEIFVDPRARALAGREAWGEERDVQKHQVRGVIEKSDYDWEGDAPLELPDHQVVAYSLHVRGFTRESHNDICCYGRILIKQRRLIITIRGSQ